MRRPRDAGLKSDLQLPTHTMRDAVPAWSAGNFLRESTTEYIDMARTDKFREQHGEILRLASELRATLVESKLAADGTASRSLLSKLLGKLTLHLAAEDRHLYPELQRSADAAVAALSKRFATEMGGIAAQIADWGKRWPTPNAIKADPRKFMAESNGILDILWNRMQRENRELYPAADRV